LEFRARFGAVEGVHHNVEGVWHGIFLVLGGARMAGVYTERITMRYGVNLKDSLLPDTDIACFASGSYTFHAAQNGISPMFTVSQVLLTARLRFKVYPSWTPGTVFETTRGGQIIGSFIDLDRFRAKNKGFGGWHRHHIVEKDTLRELGVTGHAPHPDDQPCVFLPSAAHARRINSILQSNSPAAFSLRGTDLREAYSDAYDLMGDYTGRAPGLVKSELMAIVNAEFQLLGVA
jgi:hypothetical protein